MMNPVGRDDVKLTREHVQALSSADELARFFHYLGYPVEARLLMTPEALQLNIDLANASRRVERLSSVDNWLQVYLFELTSVTVARTQALARAFRDRVGNFLLVLTDDYRRLDFVLLEREVPGLAGLDVSTRKLLARARVLSVDRRDPGRVDLRVLRRFSLTEHDPEGYPDPLAQYDKLRSAYTVAEWAEPLFNNRALFSDYYLNERLPELPEWHAEGRNRGFRQVRGIVARARAGDDTAQDLIWPVLEALGFRIEPGPGGSEADLLLYAGGAEVPGAFALTYPRGRYLDGKDNNDPERPEENPGAQVVGLLEAGTAPWGIVTNGKLWRLYSVRAHSRATNYYEIDLEETLALPDPGEAFRYFYLLFRAEAFLLEPRPVAGETRELTFVDWLMEESGTYAQEMGERLKGRVFEEIFPHFAKGFLVALGGPEALLALPEEEREAQLNTVFQGTLTFLYRLLFLLYAESRDLLPVREVRGYYQVSLQRLKEEVAGRAGPLEDGVPARLAQAYEDVPDATELYDRLLELFAVIDKGSKARNVPIYNGGLFITQPGPGDDGPEARHARFLLALRLPDRYLALGLDRLARDVDPKRGDLGFIDYKSLGVRQLGSIYEGLLEFKVRVAPARMAVVEGKRAEEVVPYAEAKRKKRKILTTGRGRNAQERTLPRGTVYLENDRRERKATGSYYTPDYVVKYIVRQAVGPVLDEKLEALRPRVHEAEQHFRARVKKKKEMENVTPDEPGVLRDVAGDVLQDLFDVKVLDPAMGSGHFLVEAVDYVTDGLVRFLDGYPFLSAFFDGMRASIVAEMARQGVTVDAARLTDVTLLKRHVLKRCIYGVDLNPMAVELAKVSLWLDCFTLGAPLSFLDHHLRWGNSLIGAMAREVEAEMGRATPDGQMTFLTGPFVGLLQATSLMETLAGIADVTLEQVQESRSLFDDFAQQAKPYKQLLDIYVARHFGIRRAAEFLTLYGPDVLTVPPEKLGKPYREVIEQARVLYQEKHFFHWDLEFPEAFIDLKRAAWKEDAGFDAVVGNPPYSFGRDWGGGPQKQYFKMEYLSASYQLDLYQVFMELCIRLLRPCGCASLIVPDTWTQAVYSENLREFVLSSARLLKLVALPSGVFPDAVVDTLVYVVQNAEPSPAAVTEVVIAEDRNSIANAPDHMILQDVFRSQVGHVIDFTVPPRVRDLLGKIVSISTTIGELFETTRGINAYDRAQGQSPEIISSRAYHASYRKDNSFSPELMGEDVSRYENKWSGDHWIAYGPHLAAPREEYFFKQPKLLVRKLLSSDRIVSLVDEENFYVDQQLYIAIPKRNTGTSFVWFACAVANSRLLSYYYRNSFKEKGALFAQMTVAAFNALPIRHIHLTTPMAEREHAAGSLISRYEYGQYESLLTEVGALLPRDENGEFLAFQHGATGAEEKSDVVHDLLAYLAERMTEMHKEKQARVEDFWQALESATDADTVETLRNKGKWEQSLAADPVCRPYVDADSRSTRTLDESLGWDEGCFAAFAGMLAGKGSVTPRLLAVYRERHSAYRGLMAQIKVTDNLIDGIVYQLYGLTDEEIAIVEGRESASSTGSAKQLPSLVGSKRSKVPLANTTDAQQLVDVLQELQIGADTEVELAARVAARSPVKSVPLWLVQEICREYRGLGWLDQEARLKLLLDSVPVGLLADPVTPQIVHLELAAAHEIRSQTVTQILQRLFTLSPERQGAVILPEPSVDAPADVRKLDAFVASLLERYVEAMGREYPSPLMQERLDGSKATEDVLPKLKAIWTKMPPSKRKSRLTAVVREIIAQQIFGDISPPQEFIYGWVPRLAQAGLLMWARRLFEVDGLAIFPVVALGEPNGDFSPIVVEAGRVAFQAYAVHDPSSESYVGRFAETLYREYRALGGGTTHEYVSLLTCRDRVCYRLRIGNPVFERLLSQSVRQSVERAIEYSISLEADRTWAEQSRQAMEQPVNVNGPRYIISMRERG